MADRHHYVSQFHLRHFAAAETASRPEPWLWVGSCVDGEIRRRAPTNFGWERGTFDVPGTFAAPDAHLEKYLAMYVEAPAASALREFVARPAGARRDIPDAVMFYIAWSAARTPAMRALFEEWLNDPSSLGNPIAEAPPEWLVSMKPRSRPHTLTHDALGECTVDSAEELALRIASGWRLSLSPTDFGELAHVQAMYFYERFFPRLNWLILDAPPGECFIIGDRPVVWGRRGDLTLPPAALRYEDTQLVAPLTRTVALAAFHERGEPPTGVMAAQLNQAMALAAHEWIAGPTEASVADGLAHRASARRAI